MQGLQAFPPTLAEYVAGCAGRIDDMVAAGESGVKGVVLDPFAASRKASTSPKHSFPLSPSSKVTFLPAQHACAFEVKEERGFFGGGSTRVVLRAAHERDMQDWATAITMVMDTVVPLMAGLPN